MRHTRKTFGGYWQRWLARRRPYLEAGTWTGYEIAGRKRLVPAFGALCSMGSPWKSSEFVAELAEDVEAAELATKTVNNALGTLEVCLDSRSTMACSASTRRCGGNGSRPRTSSGTTCASTRSRATSTRARASTQPSARRAAGQKRAADL